ncbi:MAG: hypothetical protein HN929_05800 [Chloroflexi bacterium]|jgi:hypothetical protein|nr:hypothetical protein [Chloroflexota bacterium]MBT7080965.1 hypothetical protein [Chloroflexota bacterium]MBT7290082.1 hypothetical protein [Chloroflexota bacterium]
MPKRSSKDINEIASTIVSDATSPFKLKKEKNPAAVALGKLGGLKGGKARAAKLTPEQRSEIAKKAAVARWAKKSEV